MKFLKYFTMLLFLGGITTGCFDDQDDVPYAAHTVDINDFIWKGLNTFYLYKTDVPTLANNYFSSKQEYTNYLFDFSTPEAIFESLKSDVDKFSFLVDDYIALEQAFDGISRNNGMEFGLIRYPSNPANIFGYVRYVLPGTDAKNKGIQRGQIFNTINGTQITENNYRELLSTDSYTIGLATFNGTDITPTGASVTLAKIQYTENPVFLAKTLNIGGNPVGYLLYNSFTGDFDSELNAEFGKFKLDGVTDLILDLRYNGGGSVATAIDLSSMITGQFNGSIFSTEQWNPDRQAQYGGINLFDNKIRTNEAINSLSLSRIYIITTRSSASASELVINGLDPYIQVIQVGATSRGKFQASITLYDSKNFSRQGADLGHKYAMQPLVLKSINSAGFTDYFDGFIPEIELKEDYANLGVLGDENEPLLKAALDNILGITTFRKQNLLQLESIGDSKMFTPNYERMYTEFDLKE